MKGGDETLLRFTVADCLRHPDHDRHTLDSILAHLPGYSSAAVVEAYDAALFGTLDRREDDRGERIGLLAARMRGLRRPLPRRHRKGLTITEMAATTGIDRAALVALLEHHGYLELVPFGGLQRRRLVTQAAFDAELGHNVDPSSARSSRLDGVARAVAFPVFYPEALPAISWVLDWSGIQDAANRVSNKRARMAWLLKSHGHLPDQALAKLSGYSLRGVKKARSLRGM